MNYLHSQFFGSAAGPDPRSHVSLSSRENVATGGNAPDFAAILEEARRSHTCAECGEPLATWQRVTATFCKPKCRYRFRDRRKYHENPERERARARAYYEANREAVLDRAAERRGRTRVPALLSCSECGDPLQGRQRVICGASKCRDGRYRRLHPDSYAERERQKVERRREKRRREAAGS
jgi:hypothetical protein